MSKNCPSRFSEFIIWIMRAPIINIPVFIIGMLAFWEVLSQQDTYHIFIPLGIYAQMIEYILLAIVVYFIYLAYKKRNTKVDECNYVMYHLSKVPLLKVTVQSFFTLMIAYLIYHMLLLYVHKFNIPTNNTHIEVKVLDISNRGRTSCKPLMETNFLKQYNPQKQTLFFKFIKEYSFDDICLKKKNFDEGQTIILDIEESSFGMYITNIKAKVY